MCRSWTPTFATTAPFARCVQIRWRDTSEPGLALWRWLAHSWLRRSLRGVSEITNLQSGHDTTYRLDGRSADLNPVDLNALLYRYEIDIAATIRWGRPRALARSYGGLCGDRPATETRPATPLLHLLKARRHCSDVFDGVLVMADGTIQTPQAWLDAAALRKQVRDAVTYREGHVEAMSHVAGTDNTNCMTVRRGPRTAHRHAVLERS